jgi:hypothetical protein
MALFSVFPLGAANVSVQVIEAGIPAESGANQYSGLWESALLDVFFESGHIVSNAPVLRLDYMPEEIFPDEARKGLDEAIEGGMNYFAIALLEYNYKSEGGARKPRSVRLMLFRTDGCQLVHELRHTDAKVKSLKDEFDSLILTARKLAPHVK